MPSNKTKLSNGGSPVSILDLSRALAPTVKRTVRQSCHDYEGAYSYFQKRVVDQMSEKEESTWLKEGQPGTSLEGKWYLEIRLHSMPLYWTMTPYTDASGKEVVDTIYHPDGTKREERKRYIGFSRYEVDSEEHGWQVLNGLANGEGGDVFKDILTRAAAALKNVDDYENADIAAKAEMIFNDTPEWVEAHGKWHEHDQEINGRRSFSKEKTNKKNNAKQKARAALGYTRAKVVDRSVESL